MMSFDYIIAGGGAAGLNLAYQMVNSELRGKSILMVDRDAKDQNDRTWCFWTDHPTAYEHLVYRTWNEVEVVSEDFYRRFDLSPYTYKMIRGIDFYKGMRNALSAFPSVTFLKSRVSEVSDSRDQARAQVVIDRKPYEARYAFDSIFKPSDYNSGPAGYHYLKQHFKGWEIETSQDCFDPGVVTMFDFRTPQNGCMRFFYLLPYSKRHALVEYTLFSANILKPNEYDRAISEYLETVRKISSYRIMAVESGVIPMTDLPFPRKLGEHVMAIGTKGGQVKPSTGYAFKRIQRDSVAIVQSLVNHGDPFHVPASPWRYRQYDSIMLQVMYRQGHLMKSIFTRMFEKNTIQAIFAFLDEQAPTPDNLRLIASLQTMPFLKALFRIHALRRI